MSLAQFRKFKLLGKYDTIYRWLEQREEIDCAQIRLKTCTVEYFGLKLKSQDISRFKHTLGMPIDIDR
jgi:hypothetical protein